VAARPLLPRNLIVPLVNGVEAYPAMLEAIESATESIGLATYIFDGAGAGERFVDALARSKERGVEVRVLIDAVGANYSWPPVSRSLRDHGIKVALFNPPLNAAMAAGRESSKSSQDSGRRRKDWIYRRV
jgi:cardiolipin synthase